MCKKYSCEKCNFITKKHNNYENHLLTKKHNNQQTIECNFECKICNKKYKCNSGLWRHNQKCIEVKVEPIKSEQSVNEIPLMEKMFKEINEKMFKEINEKMIKEINEKMIKEINENMIKEINDLKNMIIELTKNQQQPITNNNTNNSFNLNFFLNEQCKNAINMIDFVKSIIFELKDFENIQDKGYIENKTNIILENLNKLTVYERPLHYINSYEDKTIHIKDEDQWKKETEENKPILENALKELDNNEYDDLYKTIKVTGVSQRGKKTVDYDVNKFPNFPEVKEILEKEDNEETKKIIISSILENVVIDSSGIFLLNT